MATPIPPPSDAVAPEHETRNSEPETSPSHEPVYRRPGGGGPRYRHLWEPFTQRFGRPSKFHPDLADDLYETIERYGISDTCAGRNFHISASTISRWKKDERFLEFLAEARDKWELNQVHKVEVFTRKDGRVGG